MLLCYKIKVACIIFTLRLSLRNIAPLNLKYWCLLKFWPYKNYTGWIAAQGVIGMCSQGWEAADHIHITNGIPLGRGPQAQLLQGYSLSLISDPHLSSTNKYNTIPHRQMF